METQTVAMRILGFRVNTKKGMFRVYIGFYWGYIGIMEKKMEATIMGLGFRVLGFRVSGLGFGV